ncbi:MAG: hypothetical protein ACT4OM_11585 [Actinomycetota bacterium]
MDAVHQEAVIEGRAGGHADAVAIEQAIARAERLPDDLLRANRVAIAQADRSETAADLADVLERLG